MIEPVDARPAVLELPGRWQLGWPLSLLIEPFPEAATVADDLGRVPAELQLTIIDVWAWGSNAGPGAKQRLRVRVQEWCIRCRRYR